MIADDVAGADAGETDHLARALAADAAPAVDAPLLEVAPERLRHHLAHLERRAGRRVGLVAVVGLDDLDVHLVPEDARRGLEQTEAEIHAHAHVRRVHDGHVPGGVGDALPAGVVNAGGADDHPFLVLATVFEHGERALDRGPHRVDRLKPRGLRAAGRRIRPRGDDSHRVAPFVAAAAPGVAPDERKNVRARSGKCLPSDVACMVRERSRLKRARILRGTAMPGTHCWGDVFRHILTLAGSACIVLPAKSR